MLYVRDGLAAPERLLIDPNGWAKDGATALAEWEPSRDGSHLVYAVQDGGTDWRTLHVIDTANGQVLQDEVKWAKFSDLAWDRDGKGFFYSRFPEPTAAAEFQTLNLDHKVYYHALGTAQSADRLVFATPDRPKLNNGATTTDDGRWLVINSSEGTDDRYEVTIVDLTSLRWTPRTLIQGLDNNWKLVGNTGTHFYFVTDKDAPRQRIVMLDVAKPKPEPIEIVPQDAAKLDDAHLVGERIVASYLVDAKSEARLYALDGKRTGTVTLPGIGSVAGFDGEAGDTETFFSFTSFNRPDDDLSLRHRDRDRDRVRAAEGRVRSGQIYRRAAVLRVEGRHQGSDVRDAPQGRERPGADLALCLWRLQRLADPGLQPRDPRLGRYGRRLCRGEHSRRPASMARPGTMPAGSLGSRTSSTISSRRPNI